MEEWEQACTKSDTGISNLFFIIIWIESKFSFLFYSCFCLFPSSVFVDPNETDSFKVVLPLQVPLMAYGDEYPFL